MTTKKVTFKPPDGAVPEGTNVGDTFDLVSTFRLESNGMVCLTMMGDTKMAGYDKASGQARPSYHEEASAMQSTAPTPDSYA